MKSHVVYLKEQTPITGQDFSRHKTLTIPSLWFSTLMTSDYWLFNIHGHFLNIFSFSFYVTALGVKSCTILQIRNCSSYRLSTQEPRWNSYSRVLAFNHWNHRGTKKGKNYDFFNFQISKFLEMAFKTIFFIICSEYFCHVI